MPKAILSTANLICGYHPSQPLTAPLNLDIARNDIVAILGTNGRGKSTLLHTLLGIEKPLSGDMVCHSALSFVPQHFSPIFDYCVLDIILMGRAKQLGLLNKPQPHDRLLAQQVLQRLGLQNELTTPFNQLSGGQQQLVLIARAITAECQILLLDEPTSALDLHNQKKVLQLLADLVKERDLTVIFSTHDPAQALAIANKVLLLEQGQYQFAASNTLLTEHHLSRLYGITMKRLRVGEQETIVPIYLDD